MRDRVAGLTRRELLVLRRLAHAGTQADIARELFVSVNTIKSHVASIYAKLGVGDRQDAVRRGQALGILARAASVTESVPTVPQAIQYLLDMSRVYKRRDCELFERIHRDDVRWFGPVSSCSGVASMRDRAMELAIAVPDLRAELRGLTVEPDRNVAIYEYTVMGTHLGPLGVGDRRYPATGKRFQYPSMAIVTFDRTGLVAEVRSYWDFIDILRQVGLAAA